MEGDQWKLLVASSSIIHYNHSLNHPREEISSRNPSNLSSNILGGKLHHHYSDRIFQYHPSGFQHSIVKNHRPNRINLITIFSFLLDSISIWFNRNYSDNRIRTRIEKIIECEWMGICFSLIKNILAMAESVVEERLQNPINNRRHSFTFTRTPSPNNVNPL